jgi:hypothetical protein
MLNRRGPPPYGLSVWLKYCVVEDQSQFASDVVIATVVVVVKMEWALQRVGYIFNYIIP